ncbi:Phospholipase_D-nuclease N-terminal [Asanoa hainanensis]|uniref:Phospholipase_D-nuclease N-terminal n=1 Tax=Asanoa hainanensis TaxID=560556 RepID=A0A239JNV3_9ACTN|nr:PLD nuclease N-terminal domain-containing protein [Asanoa hainanensis]SNT07222.1 Phospholipase_D-nuclease N-terminal [Asanoa hainanensis]
MVRLYGLLFVAQLVLAVAALISCLSADEGEIRALPRIAWVLIILFFPLVGGVAWFLAGRPVQRSAAGQWRPGSGFPEAERPRQQAPDDDPEFLKSLNQRSKEDTELFERWEADLRRREEDLRKEKEDPPAGK